jgi:bile acid-coenzyme A ligase
MSDTSIGAVTTDYARCRPDALAISYGDDSLSWSELDRGANRWARLLARQGVAQDDLVALTMPNGIEFHQASFAIWKLGATPCIFSSRLPPREFAQIVELAAPKLVVGPMPEPIAGVRQIDLIAATEAASDVPLPDAAPRFWKAMTSGGSTGRPKIIVDHQPTRFDPARHPLVQLLHIPPGGVMLNPGPLYHNAPFLMTSISLFAGTTVIGMKRFDAEECLRQIEAHSVEFICLVPTMMHRIWALPQEIRNRYDLSSLRVVWHMAAACPPWLKTFWIDWLGAEKIWELYGGTEAAATVIRGDEWLAKPGSVGRVEPGTTQVLREDGEPAAVGEVGEIFLPAGSCDKFHYIGSEAKTSADGRLSLGDLGYLDEDGYLFLADRRTDLIIRGGANIYPAEIEAALDEFPDIISSVVIGLPCDEFGQRAHAILEIEPGNIIEISQLTTFLRERLAPYKLPESYEISIEQLRNEAGKVRRSALKSEREAWLEQRREFQVRS